MASDFFKTARPGAMSGNEGEEQQIALEPDARNAATRSTNNEPLSSAVDFESGVIGPGEGKYPLLYIKKSIADAQRSVEIEKGYWKISRR